MPAIAINAPIKRTVMVASLGFILGVLTDLPKKRVVARRPIDLRGVFSPWYLGLRPWYPGGEKIAKLNSRRRFGNSSPLASVCPALETDDASAR
jgi:hypothetical protein